MSVSPRRVRALLVLAGSACLAALVPAGASGAAVTGMRLECAPSALGPFSVCPPQNNQQPWFMQPTTIRWVVAIDGVFGVPPVTGVSAAPSTVNPDRWCRGLNQLAPAALMREGQNQEFCRVIYDDGDPLTTPNQTFPPVGQNDAGLRTRLDTTPPTAQGSLTRAPDVNGWYNRPVDVRWTGTDTGSGVASCSPLTTFSGPGSPTARVVGGTCTDRVGLTSAPGQTASFRYDATPPTLEATATAGGTSVLIQWKPGIDATDVEVTRTDSRSNGTPVKIYGGLLGNQVLDQNILTDTVYTYRVSATDQAGNVAAQVVTVVIGPTPPPPLPPTIVKSLMTPPNRSVLRAPPMLRWPAVANVQYYNVQLYIGRYKVLSVWPKAARYQVPNQWRYRGTRYRVARTGATIRWHVWPILGTAAKPKAGKLIGSSRFTIKPKKK